MSKISIDRSEWPSGEWDNEPDKIKYQEIRTGYPCLIIRNQATGHLCGFVGIDKENYLFNADWGDINYLFKTVKVNYSDSYIVNENSKTSNIWWIGFGNSAYSPGRELLPRMCQQGEYHNIERIKKDVSIFAEQLKDFNSTVEIGPKLKKCFENGHDWSFLEYKHTQETYETHCGLTFSLIRIYRCSKCESESELVIKEVAILH